MQTRPKLNQPHATGAVNPCQHRDVPPPRHRRAPERDVGCLERGERGPCPSVGPSRRPPAAPGPSRLAAICSGCIKGAEELQRNEVRAARPRGPRHPLRWHRAERGGLFGVSLGSNGSSERAPAPSWHSGRTSLLRAVPTSRCQRRCPAPEPPLALPVPAHRQPPKCGQRAQRFPLLPPGEGGLPVPRRAPPSPVRQPRCMCESPRQLPAFHAFFRRRRLVGHSSAAGCAPAELLCCQTRPRWRRGGWAGQLQPGIATPSCRRAPPRAPAAPLGAAEGAG